MFLLFACISIALIFVAIPTTAFAADANELSAVAEEEITAASGFKTDLALSSFDIACIMDEIEEAMGVRIEIKDFVNNKTVGEMAEYIASLK